MGEICSLIFIFVLSLYELFYLRLIYIKKICFHYFIFIIWQYLFN